MAVGPHGFYFSRRRLELDDDFDDGDGKVYAECANVPRTISIAILTGRATLHELDTVYGLEDLYDLLEISLVDAHNNRVANRKEDV